MADLANTTGGLARVARLFAQSIGIKGAALICTLLMFAGASHCFIKGWLLNSTPTSGYAFAWAAVTLLPWIVAWEANKLALRRFTQRRQQAQAVTILMLLSLAATGISEWLLIAPPNLGWPTLLGLHTLRHLPEIGVVGLLTVISAYVTTHPKTRDIGTSEALNLNARFVWARAAGNYVEFKIGQSVRVERITLRQVEMALDPSRFVRINRFMVVNRSHIVGSPRGSWIRMSDNSEHRIGDAFRQRLR